MRQAPPGPPGETTEYIQPDRKREEHSAPGVAIITRCDLDRWSILSLDERTFSSSPLSTRRHIDGLSTRASGVVPGKATLLVHTTTVDTGERTERFGYRARRVIITRKEVPLPGARSRPAETWSDGWYIDLNPQISCYDEGEAARSLDRTFLNASTMGLVLDEPTFTYHGARETGYPIEETRTFRRQVLQADGMTSTHTSTWSMRVTALSTEPQDAALFEIPADFRDASTVYRPPAPSLWDRLLNTWYWFQSWFQVGR